MKNNNQNRQSITMHFIHFSVIIANIIYAFILWYIHYYAPIKPALDDPELQKFIQIGIVVYAAVLVLVVTWFKRHLLSAQEIASVKDAYHQEADSLPPYYGRYMSILFILWAMIESLAIFGIIYYLLFADLIYGVCVIGLSILLIFFYGPKKDDLQQLKAHYDKESSKEYEKL